MTFFAISMPCLPSGGWGRALRHSLLALGLTGAARRIMSWLPLPIVMGMVAGIFLQFGLDWIKALADGAAFGMM